MSNFFNKVGNLLKNMFIGLLWLIRFLLGIFLLIIVLINYALIKLLIVLYGLLAKLTINLFPPLANILQNL